MSEQRAPGRRFWLSGRRDAEQDRFFREALEPRGWQPGDERDWDTAWVTGMPEPAQFRRVSPRRKINHFPGNAVLTVKNRLHDSLATLRERIVDAHGADSELARRLDFFPRAYVMPGDYHALQAAAEADPTRRWILKPTNASKGKGVRVLRDVAEAPLAPDWLVQEYLANPHTIRGHKYVLRLYVLIASLEPLRVYRYRQGFAKLASEPWDPEDADNPYSQLTNPDINALNDRAEVPVEFIDLDRYRGWLLDRGHDADRLFSRLDDLVALTAIAGVDAMRRRTDRAGADPRGCYELLGLDCLVDDTLKPWILECNLSPSLGICAAPESGGRVEEAVKGGLVHDLVRLVDIPGDAADPVAAASSDSGPLMAEAEAEHARAGGFERLLPATQPMRYLPYFSLPSLADLRLAETVSGAPLPQPHLRRRQVAELVEDDRLALYATRTGHYYRPNDTAALIWLLATEGVAPEAIAEALVEAASGTTVDPETARNEVWATLGEWCREGLLCQQGEARPAGDAEPVREAPAVTAVSGGVYRLALADREWVLRIASGSAQARLARWFGESLMPLDEDAVAPTLRVLSDPAGYTLVENDRVLATRLTLAQLGPTLIAWLMRGLADAARPVVDAGLWIDAEGRGVLCLDGDASEPASWPVPADGTFTRGVRLAWQGDASLQAEPLGLPLSMEAERPTASLAPGVPIVGVLWQTDSGARTPRAQSALDALGALLPRIVTADAAPLSAAAVAALHDWLAGTACASVAPPVEGAAAESVENWLTKKASESDGPVKVAG
ncbi:MAG: PqqD family peptide modification chaperone [Pseudomonadota bacterium]